jgi:hypothetical protein
LEATSFANGSLDREDESLAEWRMVLEWQQKCNNVDWNEYAKRESRHLEETRLENDMKRRPHGPIFFGAGGKRW